jgi:DNA-binding NarL/FixJ family response regulator
MISGSPGVKLLALSMYSNPEFMDGMLKAGASGYLLKDQAFEELIRAIQTVVDNRIYIFPGIEDSAAPQSG